MPRSVIAVSLLLGTGCLIPNPAWSEAGGSGTTDSTGTTATAMSSSSSSSSESGAEESSSGTGEELPPTAFCPELPSLPDSATIVAAGSSVAQINAAIEAAGPDGIVALEPGSYAVAGQPIVIDQPGATLRSTTGDAGDVVIDGAGTAVTLVRIRQSGVTLAGLTIRGSVEQGVLLGGDANIEGITLTHLVMLDLLRAGVATIIDPTDGQYADRIEVACSHFGITEARRLELGADCAAYLAINFYSTRDSVVRDSLFTDYFCDMAPSGGVTVRFTAGSRDSIVERNRFLNTYRGVIFGGEDPSLVTEPARVYADAPCGDGYWGHIGGVIRNNLFWNGSDAILASAPGAIGRTDSAISFWTVCDGAAYHNTVVSLMDPDDVFGGIEWRWPTTTVEVINNLVTDTLLPRQDAVITVNAGNIELANPNEVIDPLGGDLHLAPTAQARGGGVPLAAVSEDFEGDARDQPPDVGADEFVE